MNILADIRNEKEIHTINSLTVHAGGFHRDDVFCAAIATIINPDVTIQRRFAIEGDPDRGIASGVIVADVGRGRYDHHDGESTAKYSEDGIRHCAATLLWLDYGIDTIKMRFPHLRDDQAILLNVWYRIYNGILRTIALDDNYGEDVFADSPYVITRCIKAMNSKWNSDAEAGARFAEAVKLCRYLLTNELESRYALAVAEEETIKLYNKAVMEGHPDVVTADRYLPRLRLLGEKTRARIFIYPSDRGGYNMQFVKHTEADREVTITVPDSWRESCFTYPDGTPVQGLTFCHPTGFLAVFDTAESRQRAADRLLWYRQAG